MKHGESICLCSHIANKWCQKFRFAAGGNRTNTAGTYRSRTISLRARLKPKSLSHANLTKSVSEERADPFGSPDSLFARRRYVTGLL